MTRDKRATNICFNVLSRKGAVKAVDTWHHKLGKENATHWEIVANAMDDDSVSFIQIVDAVRRVHPLLERDFFTGIGNLLMALDGAMMLDILTDITRGGMPALGIHDSVVCRERDASFVRHTMMRRYRTRFLFDPVIK